MLSHHPVYERFLRSMKRRADNTTTWNARRRIMRLVVRARSKTFDPADNDKFLELKGVIVQKLEVILATGECTSPRTG